MPVSTYNKFYTQKAKITRVPVTDILEKIKALSKIKGVLKILVTPDMAADILTLNVSNRHINNRKVAKYRNLMVAGRWRFNSSSTIGFNVKGELSNCQHRLFAQCLAGISLEWILVTGLTEDSFATEDIGSPRTKGDVLSVLGINDANRAARIVNFVMAIKEYNSVPTINQNGKKAIENEEILIWSKDESNITKLAQTLDITENTLYANGKHLMPFQYWGGLFFLMSEKSNAKATEFLTRLASGENIGANNNAEIWKCRKMLEGLKGEASTRSRPNGFLQASLVITAWNIWKTPGLNFEGSLKIDKKARELPRIL